MSVTNVAEVFELIMYSSRAVSDIKRALDNLDVSEWNLKLIVREFVDLPIEGELRGFVHNNQLNAVSQYYTDAYFEWLHKNKENVARRVREFFDIVKPNLVALNSYVIDFVVFPDAIQVVELNPFSPSTGTVVTLHTYITGPCLFNWKEDRLLLREGPFALRINEEPKDENSLKGYLLPWRDLLTRAEEEVSQEDSCNLL